jgi:mxaC protein
MVLLLDRSSSMDRPFAGGGSQVATPIAPRGYDSKGQVARRLLAEFAARRNQDMFGMLVFSTNPIQVIPLTDQQALIQAAIEAGNIGRGLAKTNLGDGLIKALEFFADKPYNGSRIIILVSDGGARLDPITQEHINNLTQRYRVSLYWIYIRTRNSPGLNTGLDTETAREIAPEQLLHQFFQDLAMPYRAYLAENPQALQQAIDDVNQLQNLPIRYQAVIPRQDLSGWCYGLAPIFASLLLLAKLLEIKSWRVSSV